MRRILLFSVFLLTVFSSSAQQSEIITGTVTDQKTGETLAGVSISIKGTTKGGVTTRAQGEYSISVPTGQPAVLVFRYVGYHAKEVTVNQQKTINVTLAEQNNDLDQVVVVGYGTVAKKDLTGSVSSVKMAELNKAPVRSFDEALAGRVAGVQVTSADGRPGSGVDIVIRGNNSVTQANSPLYVVDGFLIEDPNNNVVNPADIESIDILKDASATAIYGARGANGVVVITTKKGKQGKPVFSFSSTLGVQRMAKKNGNDESLRVCKIPARTYACFNRNTSYTYADLSYRWKNR